MCDDHADFNGRGRCAETGKVGAVFAVEDLMPGVSLTTLTAVFGATKPPSEATCTQEAVAGGCIALTCPHGGAAIPAGPAAGGITAKSSGGTLTTTANGAGSYDVAQYAQALWSPQAALAFSAVGGATPAFAETFCGPTALAISKPVGAPGATLIIDRSSDLALQWTASNVGEMQFVFRDDTSVAANSVEVQCSFPASAGQGTVSQAALAKIGSGTHHVASYRWVRKIGGGGSGTCVELTAITTNNGSTGAPFNGTATFQ